VRRPLPLLRRWRQEPETQATAVTVTVQDLAKRCDVSGNFGFSFGAVDS
jgi:hypothetical protein